MIDESFWRGRRVCVTGHTGFKGAWLSLWLQALGAEVTGISDRVPTEPSLYELARIGERMAAEATADIRDRAAIADAVSGARPEVLVHMAAQPLVRPSFADPHETFEVNVIGTVNVLEAARQASGLRVAIVVTSDKCYENTGLVRGYREDDPMGGHDPYSASKGAAELVVSSYRRSFFSDTDTATGTDVPGGTALASARAGNVIGGGDWAPERLIPD
ncbi:MAG: CDP-glucose 4,6-dehydratase, partial [Solirubrobacteraceae bacterium]